MFAPFLLCLWNFMDGGSEFIYLKNDGKKIYFCTFVRSTRAI